MIPSRIQIKHFETWRVPTNCVTIKWDYGDMANKVSIDKLVTRFQGELDASYVRWERVWQGADQPTRRAACETAVFTYASAWETFRSDWHVACINNDHQRFKQHLEDQINQKLPPLAKGLGQHSALKISVSFQNHLNRSAIRQALDPSGNNLTWNTRKDALAAANKHLTTNYATAVTGMHNDDWRIIELLQTCRNLIAHRSKRSANAFNVAQRAMSAASRPADRLLEGPTGRQVSKSGLGAYLGVMPDSKHTRDTLIYQRIREISDQFRK